MFCFQYTYFYLRRSRQVNGCKALGLMGLGDNIELQKNACTDRSQNISVWVTCHRESNGVKQKKKRCNRIINGAIDEGPRLFVASCLLDRRSKKKFGAMIGI